MKRPEPAMDARNFRKTMMGRQVKRMRPVAPSARDVTMRRFFAVPFEKLERSAGPGNYVMEGDYSGIRTED